MSGLSGFGFSQNSGLFRFGYRQDSGLFRFRFRHDSGLFGCRFRHDSVVYSGADLDMILVYLKIWVQTMFLFIRV